MTFRHIILLYNNTHSGSMKDRVILRRSARNAHPWVSEHLCVCARVCFCGMHITPPPLPFQANQERRRNEITKPNFGTLSAFSPLPATYQRESFFTIGKIICLFLGPDYGRESGRHVCLAKSCARVCNILSRSFLMSDL